VENGIINLGMSNGFWFFWVGTAGIKQAVPNFPFRKNLGISALFNHALYLHIQGPYKTFPYVELWQIFTLI